ncbi:uncharacterized protein [Haliotis asinina]|uniref:uncharacterized protein n=1 Tax=Haliotis asinina TaxID=109174 RepID=UPI0035318E42
MAWASALQLRPLSHTQLNDQKAKLTVKAQCPSVQSREQDVQRSYSNVVSNSGDIQVEEESDTGDEEGERESVDDRMETEGEGEGADVQTVEDDSNIDKNVDKDTESVDLVQEGEGESGGFSQEGDVALAEMSMGTTVDGNDGFQIVKKHKKSKAKSMSQSQDSGSKKFKSHLAGDVSQAAFTALTPPRSAIKVTRIDTAEKADPP